MPAVTEALPSPDLVAAKPAVEAARRKPTATMVKPPPPPITVGLDDLVAFKSAAIGPVGNLRVIECDGQKLTVIHEDKSVWECTADAVEVLRRGKQRKVNLDGGVRKLDEDQAPVTADALAKLGFHLAPKEDFTGAGDKTYFLDSIGADGTTTLVYDLQPPGRQQPAAHVYFSSNDGNVNVGLACFAAKATVGQLHEFLSAAKAKRHAASVEDRAVPSIVDLIEKLK
jgi:hypothetical protein